MADLLMPLILLGLFLGICLVVCAACERELLRTEQEEKPHDRKAA